MLNKSKHLLTVALASLVVVSTLSASIMAGCGEDSSETTETIAVTGTSVVTNVIEETYYTDAEGNVVTETNEAGDSSNADNENSGSGDSSENKSSESSNSDSKTSSSKTSGSKDKSNNSEKSESANSSSNSSSNSGSNNNSGSSNSSSSNSSYKKKSLTIGNKNFSVGDTVTCVYKLTSPENLENFQAIIKYDSDYLKVKSAQMSGPAESGSVINPNLTEQIKFNGTNISSGYNYKKEKEFVTVIYEVVAPGSTTPEFEWEVATGVSQKGYVKNGKATDLTLTTSYS